MTVTTASVHRTRLLRQGVGIVACLGLPAASWITGSATFARAIGGTPVVLVNDANGDPLTLALDGSNVYWTNGTNVEKIALVGH